MHRTSAETTSASRGKILRWLAAFLGPNLTLFLGPNPDPKSGPKQRPKRRNENVIQFWTPFWGPDLDPKMGSGLDPKMRPAIGEFCHGRQMLSPLMCDAFRMSMTANTRFFFLWVPLFCAYSGGPFMAAMFLPLFWSCFGGYDEVGLLAFKVLHGSSKLAQGFVSD